ncbi:DUF6366 family protein [Lysinibacillus sp. LZ02]|uniref:DUF6366 family protein n=1 Tax=Lysinibacillus sp. LZ02 TaxID=3420668 RepID=UPI003D36B7B1
MNEKETPNERRERLRQSELEKNPTGSLNDGLNRASNGSLPDVTGGMGWKGTGILIVVLFFGYIVYKMIW